MAPLSGRLLASVLVASCVGCGRGESPSGHYPRVVGDDPSILLDEPSVAKPGVLNHNGKAFDRAEIDLAGAGVVWLPADSDGWPNFRTTNDGPAGKVVVELEKWWMNWVHGGPGSDIRKERHQIGVWVIRTPKGVQVTVDPGFGAYEHALMVTARFRVPPGVRVERGEPPRAEGAGPPFLEAVPQTPVPVPEGRR
jgi:hypothetical protein